MRKGIDFHLPATRQAGPLEPKGLKIGLHLDAGCGMPVEPETKAAVEAAAKLFADAGAIVTPIGPFMTADMLRLQDVFWRARSWNDFSALPPEKRKAGDMTHSVAIIDACRPWRWRNEFPPANTPSAETMRKAREKFGWLLDGKA